MCVCGCLVVSHGTSHVAISDVEAAMGCIRLLGKLTHKGVEPYLPVLWGVLFCQRTAEAQVAICFCSVVTSGHLVHVLWFF